MNSNQNGLTATYIVTENINTLACVLVDPTYSQHK